MKKQIKPKNNDLQRKRIKKLMLDKDLSETRIAEKLETSPQMICDVIAGRKQTEKYQQGIADLLGVPVTRLFKGAKK
jgi:transcriptional regulator with XRE-family HTH domain